MKRPGSGKSKSKNSSAAPAATRNAGATPASFSPRENGGALPAFEPLKPRPRLFVTLLLAFVLWLGILLALYFKQIFPERYPSARPATQPVTATPGN